MTREDLERFVAGLSDLDLYSLRGFVNAELHKRIEQREAVSTGVPTERPAL